MGLSMVLWSSSLLVVESWDFNESLCVMYKTYHKQVHIIHEKSYCVLITTNTDRLKL
jgi:hypothetical protein